MKEIPDYVALLEQMACVLIENRRQPLTSIDGFTLRRASERFAALESAILGMLDAFRYSDSRLLGAEYHARERLKQVMGLPCDADIIARIADRKQDRVITWNPDEGI